MMLCTSSKLSNVYNSAKQTFKLENQCGISILN